MLTTTDYAELYGPSTPKQRILSAEQTLQWQQAGKVSYNNDVKPILDSRCVACHACYDAPCQLKLSSFAGLDRGATKQVVYNAGRLQAADPTRLFIDATDTQGWRNKEFYPVLNERMDTEQAALDNSVLAQLLQLKRDNPLPTSGKLSKAFELEFDRELQCPSIDEFAEYQDEHPMWGMPYALPGLTQKEENTIKRWLQEGARIAPRKPLSEPSILEIQHWEAFFNQSGLKQQLVSRYIYEHLFIGHLHFQGHSKNEFFRLVRSTTPTGQPVHEIATILPYDDPGTSEFYYRFQPVEATIVEKTHFVYELSQNKMQRFGELFFEPDYTVTELPSYEPEFAANPFKTFVQIPKNSRHQFLLDDAQYFVSGFIKGPVCRGQVALNVIRDRFWIVFFNTDTGLPDKGREQLDAFMAEQIPNLTLPGESGDNMGVMEWRKYADLAKQYYQAEDVFTNRFIEEFGSFNINDIWDGDGVNRNAALTVFRHFDSATVVKGLVGDTPLTGWVVDYPIFERIHYLLVAGFNVYGSAGNQLATRMYMDFLRMNAENNFLRLMPDDQRQQMHSSWYQGVSGRLAAFFNQPYYSAGYETGIEYKTKDVKSEFFNQVRQRLGDAAGKTETVDQCEKGPCIMTELNAVQQEVDKHLREIAKLKGNELSLLPEVSFVRVKTGQENADLVYTLILNKALQNVAIPVAESTRREPGEDTVTVVPGFIGSYPNFFFSVEAKRLQEFVEMLQSARSKKQKERFYSQYGIRRTNPEIWHYADWFNEQHKKNRGMQAGLFDLNRYENR